MERIKARSTKKDKRKGRYQDLRPESVIVLLILLSILFSSFVSADTPTIKAEGTLTSIEEDGTVIIDQNGYMVDRSVLVVNHKGRPIPLRSLLPPVYVRFQYHYAPEGFVIEYIEVVKRGRN